EDLPRLSRRRGLGEPHTGQCPRQHHAVLVDEHCGVVLASLLGDRTEREGGLQGPAAARQAPGRVYGLPGRAPPRPAPLVEARLPQPRLLQRGRQGRALRRLGGASALRRGDARRVQRAPRRRRDDMSTAVETGTEIRPFQVEVPQEKIDDLRRRIEATRWPSKELVEDRTQGVQLATLKALADYWATGYDFGRIEERLNMVPQFTTEIDGVNVHFIHVRSKHEDALPLIMTHGWPGSVIEMLDAIGPLTDPTAHGGTADDAFHLVLP